MDFLVDAGPNWESLETEIVEELEAVVELDSLEEKVEKQVKEDDWVKRLVEELDELKADLGWSTGDDSNYKVATAEGDEFAYQSTSYGETPKAYGYASVSSYDNERKSTDSYIRAHEKRLTDAAQEVISRTREMMNMNKTYIDFDIDLRNAKDDVKLFRPVMWMLAYEFSGKMEIL
jgi:predicted ATPase